MLRRVKIAGRVLLVLVGGLLGVALSLLLLLFLSQGFRDEVMKRALLRADAALPGVLRIERARWTDITRLELETVLWTTEVDTTTRIAEPNHVPPRSIAAEIDTIAMADRIAVAFDLPPLMRRDLHLRELVTRGLRVDFVAARKLFPGQPEDTLAQAVSEAEDALLRDGSMPGFPSIGVDSLDLDVLEIRVDPTSTIETLALRGAAELRRDRPPEIDVAHLSFRQPERQVSIERARCHLEFERLGRIDAEAVGTIGPDWPFILHAQTEPTGSWKLSLSRTSSAQASEGLEASGQFQREEDRLVGLTVDAVVETPGTRTLALLPSIGKRFEKLPELEGFHGELQGVLSLRDETSGVFAVQLKPNAWISSGVANVTFDSDGVAVDSLSLELLDLSMDGHWRINDGVHDGAVSAHARGTRWMRTFLPLDQIPESLRLDLQAEVSGTNDDLAISGRVRGAAQRRSIRIDDLSLAAHGSTAPGAGVRFDLSALSSGLHLLTRGELERAEKVSAWLESLTLLEATPGMRAREVSIPDLDSSGSAPGSPLRSTTVEFDPQTKRIDVHDLRIEGDFGRGHLAGNFSNSTGGSFRVDLSWPKVPGAVVRRWKVTPPARDALEKTWHASDRLGVTAQGTLAATSAGIGVQSTGSIRLPGPATLAPLLPAGAQVEDLGPLPGGFDFRLNPSPRSWTLELDLERTTWVESFVARARGTDGSTVVDTLEARFLGVVLAAHGSVSEAAIAGDARLEIQDAQVLQRLRRFDSAPRCSLDLVANFAGTPDKPVIGARFSGVLESPQIRVPSFSGDARSVGSALASMHLAAPGGVATTSVAFDSALFAFEAGQAPEGGSSLEGIAHLDLYGKELSLSQVAFVRQKDGVTVRTDSLHLGIQDRELHASHPFLFTYAKNSLRLEDVALEGSLGSLTGRFLHELGQTDLDLRATLQLPEQPSNIRLPGGLWPSSVDAHLREQTGDSLFALVEANGLKIGPRQDVSLMLAATNDSDRLRIDLSLADAQTKMLEATGFLPSRLHIYPPRPVTFEGPLHVDVAFIEFPLPPVAGNPMSVPGYLDRSELKRAPVLDARAVLRGTSSTPVGLLLGSVRFPDYVQLQDYELALKLITLPAGPDVAMAQPKAGDEPGINPTYLGELERLLSDASADTMGRRLSSNAIDLVLPDGEIGVFGAASAHAGAREVMRMQLSYPLRWSLSPPKANLAEGRSMDLSAESEELSLADLEPFFPQMEKLDGTVSFDAAARGDPSNPELEGRADLSNADVVLHDRSHAIGDGWVELTGTKDAPVVNGRLEIENGTLVIASQKKDLLPAEGKRLLWERQKFVAASEMDPKAEREIERQREGSLPTGPSVTTPALAELDSLAAREATQQEVARLGPLQNASLDIRLRIPTGVWLRGKGLDILLTGDLGMVQKGGKLALTGTLRAEEGTMEFHGRRLTIESGSVTFYGGEQMNPALSLMMVRSVKDVTIRVHITGNLAEPRLELTSDPDMAESDILSYLLFDQPVDELNSEQLTGLEERAVAVAQEYATSKLTTRLSRELDLDLLTFQYARQDSAASSVTVGKYISPRVLVKYEQDIEQDRGYEIVAQFWIGNGFKLEMHTGRDEESGAVVTWSQDY